MKKDDQRRYNDNSRAWNDAMVEERKKALTSVCNIIIKKNESRTFSNAARLLAKKYEKNIAISAQTIANNPEYRSICISILKLDNNVPTKRKNDPRSTADLQQALYHQEMRNTELNREVRLLRHQIQQANLELPDNEYIIQKPSTRNPEYIEVIKVLLKEILDSGEYFWDGEVLKKEFDGSIILSKRKLTFLGVNND